MAILCTSCLSSEFQLGGDGGGNRVPAGHFRLHCPQCHAVEYVTMERLSELLTPEELAALVAYLASLEGE